MERFLSNKILLLGDNLRSCISVSEELTRNGFEVHVLGWWGIPLEKSKWIAAYHCIPRWDQNLEKGRESFAEILKNHTFRALIPINDDALEIGAIFRDLIIEHTEMIGFPTFEQWKFARNKSVLLEKFEELGLGGPQSIRVEFRDDLKEMNFPFQLPLIIKPCSSRELSEERISTHSVIKISTESKWIEWKQEASIFPVMIQEFIGGRELGFNFYAENGKIIHYYIDEQLHGEIGDEASYRCIAELTENQQAAIVAVFSFFLESISWDGIGMFDFKFDHDTVFVVEFNGRFWASIQLSKRTGSDLVNLFVQRKLLKKTLSEISINPSEKGSLRNLKKDLIYGVKLLKKKRFRDFFRWMISLKNIFSKWECIEDSVFRDPIFRIHIFKWHFANFIRR